MSWQRTPPGPPLARSGGLGDAPSGPPATRSLVTIDVAALPRRTNVTNDPISTRAPSARWIAQGERAWAALRTKVSGVLRSDHKPPPPEFEGWGFLWRPALIGFFALCAIAAGSSFSDSPFKPEIPNTWFFGLPVLPVPSAAPVNSTTILFGITLVYGGLVLLMRVWIRLADVALRHPNAPVAKLGWILALWTVPMLVVAPIFSRDVFSYAAQGEMVSHGINPTILGPADTGAGPYQGPVDTLWAHVPAPYGPLFLMIDNAIVRLSFHHELWTVVGLRLLEVASVVLLAVSMPVLAKALGFDPGHAFVLAVLNPLVVLTIVGGAHNDGLMMALLVAGLALAAKRHPVWGILVVSLAMSVKAPAALGIVYIGWEWLGPNLSVRERLRPLAKAGLLSLGVLGAFTLISGLGVRWIGNLATPGTVRSWAAPATGLGMAISGISHLFGAATVTTSGAIGTTRIVGTVAAGILTIWLLFNADRIGWLKALGYSLLALVVLGPVVQPWYLTWGLLLLAPVATGRLRAWVIGLSVVSPFVGLPGGRQLLDGIVHAPMIETGFVLLCSALLLAPLGKWTS